MSRRADLVRQRDRRHPELGVGRELDAGRHHADDRPRLAVDADGQAEHAAIAAVARLPEGVAEDHDALGARLVVAAPEAAAEEHRLAQQVEAVGGDPDARRVLRRRPRVAHGHRSAQEGGQAFVRGRAGAPVEQIGPRDRLAAAGGRLALDAEDVEPVGLGEGQAADQDGVDQREHRGVDADAQGQGRNRHDAEPSILDEEAQREAQVLQQAHDGCYGRGRRRLTGGPERHGRVTKPPPRAVPSTVGSGHAHPRNPGPRRRGPRSRGACRESGRVAAVPRPQRRRHRRRRDAARLVVDDRARRLDRRSARPRLVVADRLGRPGVRDLRREHQRLQGAGQGHLRQRLRRRAREAGVVRGRDRQEAGGARHRAGERVGHDQLRRRGARREDGQGRVAARGAPRAAARRPPSQEHLRVRDAGHRRRAPLRLVRRQRRRLLLQPSTARCSGRGRGSRSRSTWTSGRPRRRSSTTGASTSSTTTTGSRSSSRSTRRPARRSGRSGAPTSTHASPPDGRRR